MAAPLLQFESVERRRGDDFGLRIDRFLLRHGEKVAIVGPSGSGKSTCLDLIALALRPDHPGRMVVTPGLSASVDVAALWQDGRTESLRNLRARHFGYVLQTGGLIPFLNLRENAMLSRRLLRQAGEGQVSDLFRKLGIDGIAGRKPRRVSVGQRQRAAVVRALAHEPSVVLADEPTASLDRSRAVEVMKLLTDATTDAGTALIVVTHDRELALDFGFPLADCRYDSGARTSTIAFDSESGTCD